MVTKLNVKWNSKAGVEFTRVHATDGDHEPYLCDKDGKHVWKDDRRYSYYDYRTERDLLPTRVIPTSTVMESLNTQITNTPELKNLIWNIGTDPHCVEIPSAPLKSWKLLKRFYDQVNALCAAENYTSNGNAIGTGSHIHVEHKSNRRLQLKVIRDQYYRPYIAWAFSHPDDTMNAEPLAYEDYPHFYNEEPSWFCSSTMRLSDIPYGQVNIKDETLEFRVFDMTDNWEEQEEHMAYVQAYMNWIKSKEYHEPKPFKDTSISLEDAIEGFKKHIKELGLPWSRYFKYTGYIEARFALNNVSTLNHDITRSITANNEAYEKDVKKTDIKDYLKQKSSLY